MLDAGNGEICHQRVIREELMEREPRSAPDSLSGFYIKEITKQEAEPIIYTYEWLGTMPLITAFCYGLFSPDDDLHGVACFGRGMGTNAANITTSDLSNPICLERGACVHYAHRHAPSFLVAGACRMAYEEKGHNVFFAYSDPEAREVGTIYQACNWTYLGILPGRITKYRWKYENTQTGECISDRTMRRRMHAQGLTCKDVDEDVWRKVKEPGKGKYVWFEGSRSEKRSLRRGLRYEPQPYPKR